MSAIFPSSHSYLISNIKLTFTVLTENQEVAILENDTIAFKGGRVRVDVAFDWRKRWGNETRYGKGRASGISDDLSFAERMFLKDDWMKYELLDYAKVRWSGTSPFALSEVGPEASDQDINCLLEMFNNLPGSQTVKDVLEDKIGQ